MQRNMEFYILYNSTRDKKCKHKQEAKWEYDEDLWIPQ